jgi:CRISPR/Cas system-associated exonuclease Cas4 (RecB family)
MSEPSEPSRITHGSFSRLVDYEACPCKAKFRYLDKIAEPEQPDSPLVRGSKIHEDIEAYIRGKTDEVIEGAQPWADQFRETLNHRPDLIKLEEMWEFDELFTPLPPNDPNLKFRSKLDVIVFDEDDESALIVDWKSGRKTGNEVKHTDQGRTYALTAFAKYDHLEVVDVMFVYVDQKEKLEFFVKREEMAPYYVKLALRLKDMLSDETFNPHPSKHHCAYCAYKTGTLGRGANAVAGLGLCSVNP